MAEVEFLVDTDSGQLSYPGNVANELQRICEIWHNKVIGPQVAKTALTATIQAAVGHGVDLDKDYGDKDHRLSWGTLLTCFCSTMDYEKTEGQPWRPRPFRNMTLQRAEVVKLLLAAGADPNAREYWGKIPYWTPLMRAAAAGNVPQIRELLDDKRTLVDLRAGNDPERGDTALVIATEAEKGEAVVALLAGGANPRALNSRGALICDMAATRRYGRDVAQVFSYYERGREIKQHRTTVFAP